MSPLLEFRALDPTLVRSLYDFFQYLKESGDDNFFQPHPFTQEEAERRCLYRGEDLYYVVAIGCRVLGYGMLRGWDEGYQVPSLGIALHHELQGLGFGRSFMEFLHSTARFRGAERVRLKVFRENRRAIALYEKLGYIFENKEGDQQVGWLDL